MMMGHSLHVTWCCVCVRGLLRIHPSFRIVALSELPVIGSSSQQWLSSELLTMFLYHRMRPLSMDEELHVIKKLVRAFSFSALSQTRNELFSLELIWISKWLLLPMLLLLSLLLFELDLFGVNSDEWLWLLRWILSVLCVWIVFL